jgi:glycosyltransferase involved in cell wall biosynthesis
MRILLATCGAWHLRQTAKAFLERDALAGLWISDRNSTGLPKEKFRRCWPFHLAMKPIYRFGTQIATEKAFYHFRWIWSAWIKSQFSAAECPKYDVAQAIMGYATEVFDHAERVGALKVVDCANSHPKTAYSLWQSECDQWCSGEKIPIPRSVFARMERELERADVILCPSNFVRDTMIANGLNAEKCFTNPFGVDTSVFRRREQVPAKPRYICVGTICVRKGHQYLFRAFEQARAALPEAELICVGDYKRDFRLERRKWKGHFQHFEHLGHAELADLLRTCSAFVLASVEEGFARVISEAMAAGLPTIATHESGASTQVTDGVEGVLVPSRNPTALAEALIRVGNDPALNERMGNAAFRRGAQQNRWLDYGDRLLAEYERRLSRTETRAALLTGKTVEV